MRKTLYIINTLFAFLLLVSHVYALGYNMSLTSDDVIDKSITLDLSMDEVIDVEGFYGLTATLEYNSDLLELTEISGQNKFNLTYNDKTNKIVLYSPNGVNEKTTVMRLKFKNKSKKENEEIKISLTNIVASDSNEDIKINNVTKSIKNINTLNKDDSSSSIKEEKSDNNYLSDITINGKKLDFTKETLTYDIIVANDIDKIDITARSEDNRALVDGIGSYTLTEGDNEINITVTAPDGDVRKYTINVSREDEISSNDDDNLFITSTNQNNNYLLYVIPLVFIILLFVIILIIKKRKDKR